MMNIFMRPWFLYCVIISLGIFLRCGTLAGHFAHYDDVGVAQTIVKAKMSGASAWMAVSKIWTYAPLQFLFTAMMIDPQLPYKDILLYGRLPSCVSSILGIVLFLIFLSRRKDKSFPSTVVALTLVACSWQNIIYAQQMSNYAIGVTAHILILIMLQNVLEQQEFKMRNAALAVFAAIVGCYSQYSILFFMPAFWLILIYAYAQRSNKKISALLILGVMGALFISSIGILYWSFLKAKAGFGTNAWNVGPNH